LATGSQHPGKPRKGHARTPPAVESPETIAARVRRAPPCIAKERVILAPDCGMKDLPREVAQGRLKAMVEAAKILRAEFGA